MKEDFSMDDRTLLLNSELRLHCPDGFSILDAEERESICFTEQGPGICLSDPERHILVSVAWKKINGFSALILSNRDLVKQMEAVARQSMRPFGYDSGGKVTRTIAGKECGGFCYTYTAQSTDMYGESLLLRCGKTIYYFHLYARESLKEESLPIWKDLLAATG